LSCEKIGSKPFVVIGRLRMSSPMLRPIVFSLIWLGILFPLEHPSIFGTAILYSITICWLLIPIVFSTVSGSEKLGRITKYVFAWRLILTVLNCKNPCKLLVISGFWIAH